MVDVALRQVHWGGEFRRSQIACIEDSKNSASRNCVCHFWTVVRGNDIVKHTVAYWCTQLSILRYCRELQVLNPEVQWCAAQCLDTVNILSVCDWSVLLLLPTDRRFTENIVSALKCEMAECGKGTRKVSVWTGSILLLWIPLQLETVVWETQ